jgi:hypothetical protein
MDLVEWVEEAESLLRSDGLWPEQDEERARGVLEDAALEGPESIIRASESEGVERPARLREQHARALAKWIVGDGRVCLAQGTWWVQGCR